MISAFFGSLKQEFAGYNSKKLLADMMAGLTVCAVALPLALAFGVSSGASAASGLVTAIIAGVVIAVLGGASFQISGPTGAMSAVLVGIVATYGLQGVFFACFAAGVLLLLSGIFKLGRLISFIPMPVIMGFTSGIAIIIAMGQIDNFFGTVSEGGSNLEKLASYGRLGFHPEYAGGAHWLSCGGGDGLLAEKVGRTRARFACRYHSCNDRGVACRYGSACRGGRYSENTPAQ